MDPNQLATTLTAQYMQALTQELKGLNGVPQIVQPYQVWDWGGENPPMGSLPYAQIAALNLVPNTPSVDTQSSGTAGSGFGDQYVLFLNFLFPQQSDPAYQKLQQTLNTDTRALFTTQQQVLAAYKNFVNSTGSTETYTEWLGNEGASFKTEVATAQQKVADDNAALTAYAKSMTGPVAAAIKTYNTNLLAVTDPSGNTVSLPAWNTDQFPIDYVNEITGSNFGGDATNGSSSSFNVSQSTEQYTNTEVWGEGGGAGLLDWFGIETGGTFDQVDTSSFASEYSITFSFQDLRTIEVTPGQWYQPAMLSNYRNGPFISGYAGYAGGGKVYYFGQGGNLARIYTQMVVGYRPTITLDAGEDFAAYFHQKITNESTVWIGPFAFEVSGGSETTSGSVEVDGATITAKSTGDWPYIVAMVSNWTAPATP